MSAPARRITSGVVRFSFIDDFMPTLNTITYEKSTPCINEFMTLVACIEFKQQYCQNEYKRLKDCLQRHGL